MELQTNKSLLNYNTFGIDVLSRYYTIIDNVDDLQGIIIDNKLMNLSKLVLGGGSNILFTKDFDGLVLKNNISGIEIIKEDKEEVILKVGAGENWHKFVIYCVKQGFGGLENLSLIPGNVGASPMQNIGAYGVEVKNLVQQVDFIDLKEGEAESLNANDCEFGYRSSIFKTRLLGKKFISHVYFKLYKNPVLNTSYDAIEKELENLNLEPSIESISEAVIKIRQSKLPDPNKIGNAGSFFKNPIINSESAEILKSQFPEIRMYKAQNDQYKIAAGWLIQNAGWKGKTFDNFGVHKNHSLVLVNYGGAKGTDINNLAIEIQKSIHEKFGVELEKEVNIL